MLLLLLQFYDPFYPLESRLNSSSEIDPEGLDYSRGVGEIGECM